MNNYSYRVMWSDEDESYIATVPEFPLLSAFGDSAEDAIKEMHIVLEAVLEGYVEDGDTPPPPLKVKEYSGQFRLRLPRSLHARLAAHAELEGVSLNTLAVQFLSEGMGEARRPDWAKLLGQGGRVVFYAKGNEYVLTESNPKYEKQLVEQMGWGVSGA